MKPIFERGAGYPWVTAIPAKPHSFDYAKLADPNPDLGENSVSSFSTSCADRGRRTASIATYPSSA